MRTKALLFLLVAAVLTSQTSNPPQAQPGLELRVINIGQPEPPEPQPGDGVTLDRQTGDLIAASNGLRIRLPS